MFSLNRVQLIGYQTQPVSVRQTPGGTSVTDLNLVVPVSFRSESGETLSGKSFHTVTVWGALADVCGQFVRPGAQMFIAGRLQTDSWEDEQSGEKRSKTKIVATDMILLDPKAGQMDAPGNARQILGACNRADVIGNVTRDPEMRTTTSGQKVLTLGVATNDRWKDKASGEMKEKSEFHNVVVWGDLAEEVASAVHKGNRVFVSGRVQTRSWETQAGAKRTTTEIIAESFSLLGVRSSVAEESIQVDGGGMNNRRPAAARSEAADVFGADPSPSLASSVPEINYASEVKVEDLPF
ncbi:MAG TPA: single-stranded DNA-binding protein [Candidatus Peribacteraceae bacterium]|nr:single-stranded DNA-binding protein [Candidatus Peribacteraceae bacterium]